MITTHILDLSTGKPAGGIPVTLERHVDGNTWKTLDHKLADNDGRVKDFVSDNAKLVKGVYRLTFGTGLYFGGEKCFYPEVVVTFFIDDVSQNYHVPLLVSPFGYSTYRGS